MCWTSETGFSDFLSGLWQRLRGQRRRPDRDPLNQERPGHLQPDQPQPEQPPTGNSPIQSQQDNPELYQPSVDQNQPEKPFAQPDMDDTTGERFCTPCGGLGKRNIASTYCVDCQEYICGECVKYHKVLTVTKDHELLSTGEITENVPKSAKDRPSEVCEQHEDEVVKYYCPVHDYVGCHVCITLDHRTCKGVVYIQQVAKDILESQEYVEFDTKMTGITEKANNLENELSRNAESLDSCTDEAVGTIREYRRKLNTELDKLESDLQKQAGVMGKDEGGKLTKVSDQVRTVLTEIGALKSKLETFKINAENCNLYMMMKKIKREMLDKFENKLMELDGLKAIRLFKFQPNTDLLEMLGEPNGFGQLRLRIQTMEHFTDINVRSEKDYSECSITGSAMMSNCRLVVTDHSNNKIKMIDIRKDKLVSEFELSSAPWDCTDISCTEVAVSLPNEKKIVLVKTDPRLLLKREILVNDICRGVAHDDDTLIVTFPQQNEIRIMDMDGIVSKVISTDETGKSLFDKPSYVSIRAETDVIYVTNWANDTVVCLKTDGTVINVFTDKNLKCPEQVVVDSNGLVYFCGCISHNIYQLTANCELVKIIVAQSAGLSNPYSISYSSKTDRFYVGMQSRDIVKVYRAL